MSCAQEGPGLCGSSQKLETSGPEECEKTLIGKSRSDLELQVCALHMKRCGLPNGKDHAT